MKEKSINKFNIFAAIVFLAMLTLAPNISIAQSSENALPYQYDTNNDGVKDSCKPKPGLQGVAQGSTVRNDDFIELSNSVGTDQNGNELYCIRSTDTASENPIYVYLRYLIQFLAGLLVLIVVLSIVIGGVQYAASSGNPEATKKAKGRVINAIIALVLYVFMTTILNFVIPGGVF